MFDNLYMKLVITTLGILNSMCKATSENKLEHGLATDCNYKSNFRFIFSKVLEFVDKVFCFLDDICGDKCIHGDSICECGGSTFNRYETMYCCIPMNETCKIQGI